jgi:hypothetical protein
MKPAIQASCNLRLISGKGKVGVQDEFGSQL